VRDQKFANTARGGPATRGGSRNRKREKVENEKTANLVRRKKEKRKPTQKTARGNIGLSKGKGRGKVGLSEMPQRGGGTIKNGPQRRGEKKRKKRVKGGQR